MSFKQFPSPHVHQQSLDSASTPEAFAKREVELNSPSMTCTDHGSLGAIYKCYELAKKNKLVFAPGLEFYARDDKCPILTKLGIKKTDDVPKGSDKVKWKIDHPDGSFLMYNKYYHGTLGFRDYAAYKTAVKLLSKADARAERHGQERKPIFTWDDIEELAAQNTTMGAGCLIGMVSRHLLNDKVDKTTRIAAATGYFERLHHLFKDRFFLEIFPHKASHNWVKGVFIEVEKGGVVETLKFYFDKTIKTNDGVSTAEALADNYKKDKHTYLVGVCNYRVWTDFEEPYKIIGVTKKEDFIQNECSPMSPNGDLQFGANVFMMGMAKRHKVPLLISEDAHFAEKKHKVVQDVRLAQQGDWKFYNSYHRFSSDEAYIHFKEQHNTSEKTFEGWIDNGLAWLEGFKGFEFESVPQLPTRFYPSDSLAYTKELIVKNGRMPKNDPRYIERLKKELDILHRNGIIDLLPYFFVGQEICSTYANQGLLTGPSRGSAGGLLISYILGITSIDPIKYGLSLERFITLDRIKSGKLPDLDLDFPSRDFLVGYNTEVVEVEAEDGTTHVLPSDFIVKTNEGALPIGEVVERRVDFEPWWQNEKTAPVMGV